MVKTCTDWEEVDYIRAVCPHCGHNDTYFGYTNPPIVVGSTITCWNKQCGKQFKLGERE